MKESHWDEKKKKWVYVCPICKKYEDEWYVSKEEWDKLPDKFKKRSSFTPCKKCFKKITKTKKIKQLTFYEIMLGKASGN